MSDIRRAKRAIARRKAIDLAALRAAYRKTWTGQADAAAWLKALRRYEQNPAPWRQH
jgi:hypothetical protein